VDDLTVEAHAKTSEGWIDLEKTTKIPLDILDTAFAFGSVIPQGNSQGSAQGNSQVCSQKSSQGNSVEEMNIS
jgi:hypothetical protein